MRDDPIIENMMRSGYSDGKEPQYPICPVCGAFCDTIYRNSIREIVGCEECISTTDAWETEECFPEKE